MLKKENTGGDSKTAGGSNNWARVCDACGGAACTVYCKADSAYLCSSCDARIHAANRLASRHERVRVCEACEREPAYFLCKADAASLCTACDGSIHSANPLARRHQRVPILPISGERSDEDYLIVNMEDAEEDETASWLVLNNSEAAVKKEDGLMVFGGEEEEGDEYLDLVELNSNCCGESDYVNVNVNVNVNHDYDFGFENYGDESVVPVQFDEEEEGGKDEIHRHQYYNFELGFEFESSKFGYSSTNHRVPISSMDVGMASDSTVEEVSNMSQYTRPPKGTIDLFSNPSSIHQMSTLLSPRDREARVLRYREKKKTRKFEKTIRYASRKAYAETRPRIKGRFAKRSSDADVELEVDQMFAESGYGIVPGF